MNVNFTTKLEAIYFPINIVCVNILDMHMLMLYVHAYDYTIKFDIR